MNEVIASLIAEARRKRSLLGDVTIVAVTGSCGKTTTKDLCDGVLASQFRGTKSEDTKNCGLHLAETVMRASPADDYMIQELGAWGPGTLDEGIDFIRPDIAIVTNLRHDHNSSFHGPRGAQAEKGKLVAGLSETGVAVLNWDDPLVRELATWTSARCLSIGRHSAAELRAWDVSSRWPDRLTFTVGLRGETARVRTRLVGEHLLGSALAAIAVASIFGMSLSQSAEALQSLEPTFRRMSPVDGPDGVTFVRDDWKAPADSFDEVIRFMRDARSRRKVAVFGRVSDFSGRSRREYERIAEISMAVFDATVFVGERAVRLWGEHTGPSSTAQQVIRREIGFRVESFDGGEANVRPPGAMLVFRTVRQAADFLSGFLIHGDLVLLKGSGPADHLERVILTRDEPVHCWLVSCGRLIPCDACELVRVTPETSAYEPG